MLSPIMKTIINDIDLGGLADLVEAAETSPEEATLGFQVVTRWDGQFRSETRVAAIRAGNGDTIARDHVIKSDEPEELLRRPIPRSC